MRQFPTVRVAIMNSMLDKKEPVTGYQLDKENAFSHQAAYKELKNFHRKGLVSRQHEPQLGRPDKQLYAIIKRSDTKKYLKSIIEKHVAVTSVSFQDMDAVVGAARHIGKEPVIEWMQRFIINCQNSKTLCTTKAQKYYRENLIELAKGCIEEVEKGK